MVRPGSSLEALAGAERALIVGMGGGGDVVGALALSELCEETGTAWELGGVAWERMPVDPHPGPRPLGEIRGGRPLGEAVLLADGETTTPEGAHFAESRMAAHLGRPTALLDVTRGPAAIAAGIETAAAELGCDLVVVLDVGGDVLAVGNEEGLASPLCDAVVLAAATLLPPALPSLAAVYGPGCDGELTPTEVLGRVAELEAAGALLGTWALTPRACELVETAARSVPTEASLMATRCARGERGPAPIRGGRRTVELTSVGALTFLFDPATAVPGTAPLAAIVRDAGGIEQARDALAALGIDTELDLERERAGGERR
jgi:hypothetical protein